MFESFRLLVTYLSLNFQFFAIFFIVLFFLNAVIITVEQFLTAFVWMLMNFNILLHLSRIVWEVLVYNISIPIDINRWIIANNVSSIYRRIIWKFLSKLFILTLRRRLDIFLCIFNHLHSEDLVCWVLPLSEYLLVNIGLDILTKNNLLCLFCLIAELI